MTFQIVDVESKDWFAQLGTASALRKPFPVRDISLHKLLSANRPVLTLEAHVRNLRKTCIFLRSDFATSLSRASCLRLPKT